MSAAAALSAPTEVEPATRRRSLPAALTLWPLLVATVNAVAFVIVEPDVGDLQAALARASAARDGVGLGYWFQWFGGGATPGNYSVVTPWLSSLIGAPLLGALATVAITGLAAVAARGTAHPVAAVWAATFVAAFNLWSGRVPFALGTAVAVAALAALRSRRVLLAWALTILSCLCSPVTAAFLAFVLGAAFLVQPAQRRLLWPVIVVAGVTLISIALFFGTPGTQPYPILSALLLASLGSLWMLIARPAPSVRIALWLTAIAAPLFSLIPNGMGSNWTRMSLIWLPAAVAATAVAKWWRTLFALLPALIMGVVITAIDLHSASTPSASTAYYTSLIRQLDNTHNLRNYRLEVVQDTGIHTAAYALIGHAALAGGYETQEQNTLNAILANPDLDATSYKVWLDNNAVGYVAFNKLAAADNPEYMLLKHAQLPYLNEVSSDAKWTLYRVRSATPIVPAPQRLVAADQKSLTISVRCACSFDLRVRYSGFLQFRTEAGTASGTVADDGSGWTTVSTPAPGTYVLSGSVTRPLR